MERNCFEFVAMDKFKAILFMVVYETNVDWNNKSRFNEDCNICYNIYAVRNLNHRGNIVEGNMTKRIDDVFSNPSHAMCNLLGFFSRFVLGINQHSSISADLVEFAELCCKKNK